MTNTNKRMKVLKVARSSVLFFSGIIYYWIAFTLVAGYCIPILADPVAHDDVEQATLPADGSGHGSLWDILGLTDDDAPGDDSNGLDGSEVDDDEGGSAIMPEAVNEDSAAALDDVGVKCFRCHGDGISGCDVLTMLHDVQTFSVTCFGKCLNLSSGSTSVYDCAHDMVSRIDTCLKNGDTEMCFCTGDFCNGPSEVDQVSGNSKIQFFNRKHSLQLGRADGDIDYNYHDKHSDIIRTGKYSENDINTTSMGHRSGRKSYKNLAGFTANAEKTEIKVDSSLSRSLEQKLSVESSTEFQRERPPKSPHIFKTEIDVIISERFFSKFENFTSLETATLNPVDINELLVGNLKVSEEVKVTGRSSATETVSNNVILLVCSMFIVQCVL